MERVRECGKVRATCYGFSLISHTWLGVPEFSMFPFLTLNRNVSIYFERALGGELFSYLYSLQNEPES